MGWRRARPPEPPARRRLVRLGLRARITLSFAFGALVLSSALASITYFTTRRQILSQEASSLQRQAYANAEQLLSDVNTNGLSDVVTALSQIDNASSPPPSHGSALATGSFSLLYIPSTATTAYSTSPEVGARFWPRSLVAMAKLGTPATQFAAFHGTPHFFVGVPIPSLNAVFLETFALEQTSRTLQIIFAALVAAGIVTTLAGAILGRWAAGRALRPLRDVSQAAVAIASGRLGTRLETADVRDLAVLAASFNRMVDQLQQRIVRDARFTSDVSHELRSPLTTLAASLSVIEARREELPERSRQALDLVTVEVRRFQRMVGELLEISRFDAGSADIEASVLEVGELVRRAVAASGKADVPVEVDPAVEGRPVVVDKRRIERVMTNLLENAEHYAGGAARVLVTAHDMTVRIAVEDDGPGIPATERERVFERFARGATVAGRRGSSQGTGLGLALVSEHVKLHGGRVWVEEAASGGARFVVELPLVEPEEGDEEGDGGTGEPAGERDAARPAGKGEKDTAARAKSAPSTAEGAPAGDGASRPDGARAAERAETP